MEFFCQHTIIRAGFDRPSFLGKPGRRAGTLGLTRLFITTPIICTQTIFLLAFAFFLGYVFFQESFSKTAWLKPQGWRVTSTPSAVAHTRLQQVLAKLKKRKFRITPQRLAVLEALVASDRHPSVEQVYSQVKGRFPTTSLATVYKTVALLKEMNEVLELGFSDAGNRYDALKPYPHPHVICTRCGRILDPEVSGLEALTEEMSRKTGFTIISHRLDFYGVCPECREAP